METVEWKAFSRSIVCAKTIFKQARGGQSIDGLIEQWRPNMEAVRVTIGFVRSTRRLPKNKSKCGRRLSPRVET
jgi:hypothetical protein